MNEIEFIASLKNCVDDFVPRLKGILVKLKLFDLAEISTQETQN